jgi:hypothetical protein
MDCTTPQYAQTMKQCQTEDPGIDVPIKGFFKQLELDTVIPQGSTGALALDKAIRGCIGNAPGSTLHVGVLYTKLKMDILQEVVSGPRRVYLPGFMTLYVEPNKEPKFMRVRVVRFIVTPSTCGTGRDKAGRVSKRKHTPRIPSKTSSKVDSTVTEDSDISDTGTDDARTQPECSHYNQLSGRSRYSQLSESLPFRPQVSTTLRQRML